MITDVFGAVPLIGPLVATRPGLQVPGCADGFEFTVRAVLGRAPTYRLGHRWGGSVAAEHLTHVPDTRRAG